MRSPARPAKVFGGGARADGPRAARRRTPRVECRGGVDAGQVGQVRLRYEAFFGQVRSQLDGEWAWEEATAGYVLLDSLTLSEEVGGLARFLFEDFMHYIARRKPRTQFCVLIVDEFSSLLPIRRDGGPGREGKGLPRVADLAPQVVEGMGGEEEAARILGSVETVISHRVNTPDQIVALAGTRRTPELTMRLAEDGLTRDRTVRLEQRETIDPNKVRSLPAGAAYLISRGRAMRSKSQGRRTFACRFRSPSRWRRSRRPRGSAAGGRKPAGEKTCGDCPVWGWCVGEGSRDAPILNNQRRHTMHKFLETAPIRPV